MNEPGLEETRGLKMTWTDNLPASESILCQSRPAKTFQVVLPLGILFCRYFSSDPRKRNVGLEAAQLAKRSFGDVTPPGHAGGGRQDPVSANKVGALNTLACHPHRLVIVTSHELRVSRNPVIARRKRIARAQPERGLGGQNAFLPTSAIGKRQAVISVSYREARIKPQRSLKRGKRIIEAPPIQMNQAERQMRPGVFTVGRNARERRPFGDWYEGCAVHPSHMGAKAMAGCQHAERPAIVRINGDRL